MKIMLVFPPFSQEEMFSSALAHVGGHHLPLGLYYLAAVLLQHGHDVSVIDAAADRLSQQDILAAVERTKPGVIGFNASTPTFHRAVEIAQRIKQHMPEVIRIIGGPHVTATPYTAMDDPVFDIGVIGEGEETVVELMDALESGRSWKNIAGLAYLHEGAVHLTERRPLIKDLDSIPIPAYHLIRDFSTYAPGAFAHKTLPVSGVITSRGCPNQCTFCDRSVFGQKLRQRSPENIAKELILLYRQYGIREFNFLDDTFTLNGAERLPRLFAILKSEGIAFPWSCSTRINAVNESLLRLMRDNGCWYVSFGLESGDPEILSQIRKNIKLDQAREILGYCRKLDITTKGFFMVGHPGETIKSIERSIQFALSIPLDQVAVFINTPLPGTTQYEEASSMGLLAPTDWRKFNMHNPVYVPRGLTEEILLKSQQNFMRRFFLRPLTILRFSRLFFGRGGGKRFLATIRSLPFLFSKKRSKTT